MRHFKKWIICRAAQRRDLRERLKHAQSEKAKAAKVKRAIVAVRDGRLNPKYITLLILKLWPSMVRKRSR